MAYEWHRPLERRWISFTGLTFLAVAIGGLVLIPPIFLQAGVTPLPGLEPYSALEQEGRDIYIREGCNTCHSQQVRPLKAETDRYGHYSLASEGIYDRPFLWGSRRTGPDLHRVGGRYPDSWHWIHLLDPRRIEPRSNMPGFEFLTTTPLDTSLTSRRLECAGDPRTSLHGGRDRRRGRRCHARSLGHREAHPCTDGVELSDVEARSEAIAVIAYLQSLGRAVANTPPEALAARDASEIR